MSEEVNFTINNALKEKNISYSSLEVRVKTLDSTLKKVRDKQYEQFSQLTDLVGARVICPFRSDLISVKDAISDAFDIYEFDDKAIEDPDKFGYMSLHFLCRIKKDYSGPRYNNIKNISFEIQVRTICMHAWSSIQHSLEYKGAWDVPANLRKDINALSALFYLADTQFESVFKTKTETLNTARNMSLDTTSNTFESQEINLETLMAYANSKFPKLGGMTANTFSSLVQQINNAGYKTIGEVDKDVERGLAATNAENKGRDSKFNSAGMIRVSLGYASKAFRRSAYGSDAHFLKKFQNLVRD